MSGMNSSGKASYLKRTDKSQPFFAVYNCGITHMTRVATLNVEGRSPRTVSKSAVNVPSIFLICPRCVTILPGIWML